MPRALVWRQAQDDTILSMRANGSTWAAIAEKLDMSRNTVIERGRRLHARAGTARAPKEAAQNRNSGQNDPLPPGHQLTWGLISAEPFPHS